MIREIRLEEIYQKQINLPNLGVEGQEKILGSKILVVGSGGLGSPAILYLVASGVGNVGICDNDNVEITNLPRQTLYTMDDIGYSKAESARKRVEKINPFTKISTYIDRIDEHNIGAIAKDYDVILDCTDNLETKFIIHDYAFKQKKDLVQASLYQYDGQVFIFPFSKRDEQAIACYRCLWKDIPQKYESNTSVNGVISMVPGMLGIIQALEAIKLVANLNNAVQSRSYIYNFLNNEVRNFSWNINNSCQLCCGGWK